MAVAIELDSVWKFYGDYPALNNLTLKIEDRQCCALLGRNGAGKTTLLRVLAGLSPYQKGTVNLFGERPRGAKARLRTGFLGHGIGVYEDLGALENLKFFARALDVDRPNIAASHWLDRVGLTRVAQMPVRQFSRGMRQRLALARTFLHTPDLLLLDEPFTSLDDRAIATLTDLLVEARERGATIVLSTHQLREAMTIASHVALVENGKLRFAGQRTQEMLEDPALLYRLHTKLGAD